MLSFALSAYGNKKYKYWFMAILALLSRADLGLLVAGFGVLWILEGKKKLRISNNSLGFGVVNNIHPRHTTSI